MHCMFVISEPCFAKDSPSGVLRALDSRAQVFCSTLASVCLLGDEHHMVIRFRWMTLLCVYMNSKTFCRSIGQ